VDEVHTTLELETTRAAFYISWYMYVERKYPSVGRLSEIMEEGGVSARRV
jgi:hypothetical protein